MPEEEQGLPRIVPGTDFRLVLLTAPDADVAARLARGLVEAGLAACVNRVPGLTSTYRWQGVVEEASEVLLLVKTEACQLEPLARWVRQNHPYEVPECIALELSEVERAYGSWLAGGGLS